MKCFVFTFHKCGSNWFRPIFMEIAEQVGASYIPHTGNPGSINQSVLRSGDTSFEIFPGGGQQALHLEGFADAMKLFCVRDPRDAILSQFFSWKYSHQNNNQEILKAREALVDMEAREGLEYLIDGELFVFARQLSRWRDFLEGDDTYGIVKYENLLLDFKETLSPVVGRLSLGAEVDFESVKTRTDFKAKSNRDNGEEKADSHFRKGVSGDHKNYFDDELFDKFNAKYSWIVDLLGYR